MSLYRVDVYFTTPAEEALRPFLSPYHHYILEEVLSVNGKTVYRTVAIGKITNQYSAQHVRLYTDDPSSKTYRVTLVYGDNEKNRLKNLITVRPIKVNANRIEVVEKSPLYPASIPWAREFSIQPNKWGYLNNPRWADPSRPFIKGGQDDYDGRESEEPQVWALEPKGTLGEPLYHDPCGHWHLVAKKEEEPENLRIMSDAWWYYGPSMIEVVNKKLWLIVSLNYISDLDGLGGELPNGGDVFYVMEYIEDIDKWGLRYMFLGDQSWGSMFDSPEIATLTLSDESLVVIVKSRWDNHPVLMVISKEGELLYSKDTDFYYGNWEEYPYLHELMGAFNQQSALIDESDNIYHLAITKTCDKFFLAKYPKNLSSLTLYDIASVSLYYPYSFVSLVYDGSYMYFFVASASIYFESQQGALYRSENKGLSWQYLGRPSFSNNLRLLFTNCTLLNIGNTLFVPSYYGIYNDNQYGLAVWISTDNGLNFTSITIDSTIPTYTGGYSEVAMKKIGSYIYLFGLINRYIPDSGWVVDIKTYRSINGSLWELISTVELSNVDMYSTLGFLKCCVDSKGYIYLYFDEMYGDYYVVVLRSKDSANSWEVINTILI